MKRERTVERVWGEGERCEQTSQHTSEKNRCPQEDPTASSEESPAKCCGFRRPQTCAFSPPRRFPERQGLETRYSETDGLGPIDAQPDGFVF